ncbi:MerR family transcriptional regulator [Corynebacterium glyciniphilum]|uniref:MerR family transcriptional regulator n=1 Tax=Corynebacterium glyciniphilum TaxID=1404244 RepID=UPI0009DD65C2|nr:MerR family transcriptional regulator [Corynebacterium glyciniphilum]
MYPVPWFRVIHRRTTQPRVWYLDLKGDLTLPPRSRFILIIWGLSTRNEELARRARASVKAIRYHERLGLIVPVRETNGYRSFDDLHLRTVAEIRELSRIGIAPNRAGPFVECLELGHDHSDDCVSSLAVYRDTLPDLDEMITALASRREGLQQRLDHRAGHTFTVEDTMTAFTTLPADPSVPECDGRSDHLPGSPCRTWSYQPATATSWTWRPWARAAR